MIEGYFQHQRKKINEEHDLKSNNPDQAQWRKEDKEPTYGRKEDQEKIWRPEDPKIQKIKLKDLKTKDLV